ncbi:MAG: hypothetical protein GXP08_12320 [Gammaproteobacteria bacterium]|nr:hypothetical protein [Gammaproteobacteria bacterium]
MNPDFNDNDITGGVELAVEAASGDKSARTKVNKIVDPIITYQTERFCKRFCNENRYLYSCTLANAWGTPSKDAILCEWGNASYGWMLNDLTNPKRLRKFDGRNNAHLGKYVFQIANSLPFYERWKDWRFGRKIHVPTYIQDMNPNAAKIFFALRSGNNVPLIAQKLAICENDVDAIAQRIIIELTQRNRLHLLDPPSTVSLTKSSTDQEERESQNDIAWTDLAPEQLEDNLRLKDAWQQLTPVEQYILEAMVIEEQDANDVLSALEKLNIQLNENVPANKTDRQQLYYFRRKTLARLAKLLDIL